METSAYGCVLVALVLLGACREPQPCDDGYVCHTIEVPADWHDPLGATYPLNVVVHEAKTDRIGPLFLNFGGPGTRASDYLPGFVDHVPGLVAHFDLVAVDPRGSDPDSPLNDRMDGPDGWLDTEIDTLDPGVYATQKAAIGAWLDGCWTAAPELTAHMGTMDTVRDLEAVRLALGGEPMTYVGFSYGTELGQMYADTYPHSLRAMVLAAVGRPGGTYLDFLDGQVDGFQSAFEDWAAWCAGEGASVCPMQVDPTGGVASKGEVVAQALDNAQVLTWEGYGHTAMYVSDCVSEATFDDRVDGRLPSVATCP